MTAANEIREFLVSRRAKISPERAGLPRYGRKRRVAGLRREDVALLANVSVEYYTRLERGNARGVSDEVLDAVATALQLDDAERDHLFDLVRADAARRPRRAPSQREVRPSIKRLVDALSPLPAFVTNGRLDVLYANRMAEALYMDQFGERARPTNSARFLFLDPRAKTFYVDWETVAHDIVATLRGEAGRTPSDRALMELVGLLSTRSEEFRRFWASHDVRYHLTGAKRFRHPLVGDMTLTFESLPLPADPGFVLVAYSADPSTPSAHALAELTKWSETRQALRSGTSEGPGTLVK